MLATSTLAGMARVDYMDPMTGRVVHDVNTKMGCAARRGGTPVDPWGDFSAGRWLCFLADVKALLKPIPAVGHQSFWHWVENSVVS